MTGTNQTDTSLNATNTAEFDADALSRALIEGNTAEIDRLMALPEPAAEAVVEATKEPEAVTSNAAEETETPNEGNPSTEDQVEDTTEAATSAASTATESEDVDALKRELHQYKSDAGRVPYLQRRMAELERELRATKAREVAPTQKADGKTAAATGEIDPDLQREIDELKEIDPVLARTMERIAKTAVTAANQRVEEAVNVMSQQDQEADDYRFFMEQKSRLTQAVPQADQIFAAPEWKQWKETLTPAKRAMAESGYADEVVAAIHAFAADMQRLKGVAPPAPVTQAQPTQVAAPAPENKEALEARARKAATSATPSTAGKKGETFDEEAMFREIYRATAKQNHIL